MRRRLYSMTAMLKLAIFVLAIAFVGYWLLGRIERIGGFQTTYNHSPGKCFNLKGIEYGSEDIQVLPDGLAFISSGLVFVDKVKRQGVVGKIYLFDFNRPNDAPVELKLTGEKRYTTIEPHGINIWIHPKTGEVFLYIVNHAHDVESVDKFRFNREKLSLEHVRRIESEVNFHKKLNDLIVVGEDQFYYTNFVYWNMAVEMGLGFRWGSIGFYDGNKATIVVDGLVTPNGITVSKDGKFLYVAHVGEEDIRIYKRNADNSLTYEKSIYVGTISDNLDIDADTGDLWVGSHPSFFKLLDYVHDMKGYLSPSQVFRIRFPPGSSEPVITEVYANDGSQQEASTVAVKYKRGLLIGSVGTRGSYCQLNNY